jgi:hypothetical protein
MTINIELRPEEEPALRGRAEVSGPDLSGYVRQVLQEHLRTRVADRLQGDVPDGSPPTLDDLIDREAIASCAKKAHGSITPEEIRAASSKIRDSIARVVIEDERAERF